MITGVANANYEATIPLVVQAIYGQEEAVEAIIDTGFTGSLTLPPFSCRDLEGHLWNIGTYDPW